KILGDIPTYHSDPADVAREAVAAGVRLLVFTHFTPPPDNAFLRRIFRRDVEAEPPRGIVFGEDGTLIVLPSGSDVIDVPLGTDPRHVDHIGPRRQHDERAILAE